MRLKLIISFAAFLLVFALATPAVAQLAPYNQDFEGLLEASVDWDQSALANDGWVVYVNGFAPWWEWWYGYGAIAPNGGWGGPAFSAVITGQGGPEQGNQQLNVFSDYNNGNHRDGSNIIIETNVYQERTISAADVGYYWLFDFDAKRGDIAPGVMAEAFIKTLDPNDGWKTTNNIGSNMAGLPPTWDRYSGSILIDPSLVGQILQFGFVNWAQNEQASGIFYDNITFLRGAFGVELDIRPGSCPNPINRRSQGMFVAAVVGTADFDVASIDVASLQLEGLSPIHTGLKDAAAPSTGGGPGCANTDPDGWLDLTMQFDNQEIIDLLGTQRSGYFAMTLTGTLLDGTPILGQDNVLLVGRGGGPGSGPMGRLEKIQSSDRDGNLLQQR